jgi:hypothetical protein
MQEPFDFTIVFLLIVIRTKGILISMALRTSGLLLSLTVIALATARIVFADESGSPADLQRLRREIKQLQSDETAQRRRVDQNEQLIKELETQLRQVESQNQKLNNAAQQLVSGDAKLKSETNERLEQFQAQLGTDASPGGFSEAMSRYLGTHQFTFAGAAAGDFIYDRNTSQNTFSLQFEPIALYRLNDWILFEGTINALLPVGSKSDFELPVATAQIFLNDYLEINAGIFDQPFGDWLEDQSPLWVNRFITAPLLYGAEAVVPPTDIGVQARGSMQWGALGQDVDYTLWIANGPSFDSALPTPVVGQTLNPQNNIALNSNGRAFGGRFRLYPFPLDAGLGRLELGASTYDGKWLNSNWFNAWGVDFAYLNKDLQTRGEFVQTYRQMPGGAAPDNRQGWYLQAGYFLQHVPSLHLGEGLDNTIHRLELLTRYSGVNQRAIVAEEVSTIPAIGFNGSPAIFSPHAREVALGVDYWIEPSIVWQTEFDFELPRAGGTILAFNGANTPTASAAGATANDRALLTQFAIGF